MCVCVCACVCMCVLCMYYSWDISVHYGSEDFHPLSHHCVVDQLKRQRVLQESNEIHAVVIIIIIIIIIIISYTEELYTDMHYVKVIYFFNRFCCY